nr:MAG TPA: Protein of unknown function (DUF1642) [Caudoviricetes sp.]
MNIQELIEKFESLDKLYGEKFYVALDDVLDLVKQLDEPETGHADEAPRYVKNVLARLRELPLHDREVWLKAIMGEFEQDFSHAKWREGYEQGKFEGAWVGNQLKDADKIRQELNKPVIPQFVAEWVEVAKTVYSLSGGMTYGGPGVNKWLENEDNQRTFALAWFDGYTVEKPKLYIVRMKNICKDHETLNCGKLSRIWSFSSEEETTLFKTKHTRKQLEEAGFAEVFNSPLFEVEEVTE